MAGDGSHAPPPEHQSSLSSTVQANLKTQTWLELTACFHWPLQLGHQCSETLTQCLFIYGCSSLPQLYPLLCTSLPTGAWLGESAEPWEVKRHFLRSLPWLQVRLIHSKKLHPFPSYFQIHQSSLKMGWICWRLKLYSPLILFSLQNIVTKKSAAQAVCCLRLQKFACGLFSPPFWKAHRLLTQVTKIPCLSTRTF